MEYTHVMIGFVFIGLGILIVFKKVPIPLCLKNRKLMYLNIGEVFILNGAIFIQYGLFPTISIYKMHIISWLLIVVFDVFYITKYKKKEVKVCVQKKKY